MSNKPKQDSPLVQSVLALDSYLAELERIGSRINSTDLTSDFDVEHIQKLMTHFAETGQGISSEVINLSTHLRQAQARAETVAKDVSRQADLFKLRTNEHNDKLEQFRILGEKVRELNTAISQFPRADLASNIPNVESQLTVLIEELQALGKSARDSRMRALEKNAESLAQTLQAVRQKLRDL